MITERELKIAVTAFEYAMAAMIYTADVTGLSVSTIASAVLTEDGWESKLKLKLEQEF